MDICNIIKQTYIEHPDPRLYECIDLAQKYERIAQKLNASFMETFSTSVFPKLITNCKKEKEYVILWDNHFWDLFERYLLAILRIEKNELDDPIAYDWFMSIYMIFLSTKFYTNPELSLVFAKHYAATGFFVPPYHIKDTISMSLSYHGGDECLLYCKDYVFFHEMHHALYNKNQNLKDSDFKLIIEACHILDKSSIPQETKNIINEMLSLSDTAILEELCCDVNSLCCVVYLYSGGDRYDEEIAKKVIKSIRYISLFINNLKKIYLIYKASNTTKSKHEIEAYIRGENYIEIEARNFIIYFIALYMMGISKMNFQSDFFLKDDCFFKHWRPYNDILSFDFISNIFSESELYRRKFNKSECKVARDIIIGWHNGN